MDLAVFGSDTDADAGGSENAVAVEAAVSRCDLDGSNPTCYSPKHK